MLISAFRDRLLCDPCCVRPSGNLIEIPNSENERDLRKVFVDCSEVDDALLIRLERKNSPLCPLFRTDGASPHQKSCDGILLLAKSNRFHAVFCELKTKPSQDAKRQIANSHLFFNYAHELAKTWHNAPPDEIITWFAVITTGHVPVRKFKTRFDLSSVPNTHKPSRDVSKPRSLRLVDGEGQSARNPLQLRKLAAI